MKSLVVSTSPEVRENVETYLNDKNIYFKKDVTPEWVEKQDFFCHFSLYTEKTKSELKKLLSKSKCNDYFIYENKEDKYEKKLENIFLPKEYTESIKKIKEAYLNPNNNYPWVIAFSGGKDSTGVAICIWIALKEIPPTERRRKIYFITSDTKLEHKPFARYMNTFEEKINKEAKKQNLDCVEAHLVSPKIEERFGVQVVGKGLPLPTPANKNRWCTDKFKIKPAERFIKDKLKKSDGVVVFTGVRKDESGQREKNIEIYGGEEFIFPKTDKKGKIQKGRFQCHPLEEMTKPVLWYGLKQFKKIGFPFGIAYDDLIEHYEDSGECPMQMERGMKNCGNSRNGCNLCMMVKHDFALDNVIKKDEKAIYLKILREKYQSILNDPNMRRPFKKDRLKHYQIDAYNPFIEDKEEIKKNKKNKSVKIKSKIDKERASRREEFLKVNEGVTVGTKPVYPDIALGSHSLQARIFILKNVLYYQKLADTIIITEEEVELIKECWKEEFDWIENEKDLKPEPVEHDGTLKLKKDYKVNKGKTNTYQNLVLPKEYNLKNGKQKVLNETDGNKNYLFYVHRDMSGSEKDIFEWLIRSEKKTKVTIPYFFENAWKTDGDKKIFWNSVCFVVVHEDIKTYNQAIEYVESYIEEGIVSKEVKWDNYFKIY